MGLHSRRISQGYNLSHWNHHIRIKYLQLFFNSILLPSAPKLCFKKDTLAALRQGWFQGKKKEIWLCFCALLSNPHCHWLCLRSAEWCASSTSAHDVITLPCDLWALLFVEWQFYSPSMGSKGPALVSFHAIKKEAASLLLFQALTNTLSLTEGDLQNMENNG